MKVASVEPGGPLDIFHLRQSMTTTLKDGIEVVTVHMAKPWQVVRFMWEFNRVDPADAKEHMVEWLMFNLGRPTETDRVCGLTVEPKHDGSVVAILELRQPGKQFEAWLREASAQERYDATVRAGISERACGLASNPR